jgi:hypothetical protein
LRPLVEVLRVQYHPFHYNFHTRYVYYDLPADVVGKLHELFFVRDGKDLRAKRERAEQWFYETLAQIEPEAIVERLGTRGQGRAA